MKRQSSDTASLVYAYGCGQPISGTAQAHAEAELCAQMWDRLVAADRLAQDALRARAAQAEPDIAERSIQIQRLTLAIAEDRSRAGALRAERRLAWRALNQAVAAWGRAHPQVRDEIEAARIEQVIAIRRSSGLYWGNYNRVIESYDRTRKRCRTMGKRLQLADLERDAGCLTVQIQRTRSGLGAAPGELQDGSVSDVQIARVDPLAYDSARGRCERQRAALSVCELRINAAGERIRLPVWVHRPLPADCRVKMVQLTWHSVAGRRKYQLALTIARPRQRIAPSGTGCVNLTPQARLMEDGSLLVASAGAQALILPQQWMQQYDRVERLTSLIQSESDRGRPLSAFLRQRERELPHLRHNLIAARQHLYRNWAKMLARSVAEIRLPDMDLARELREGDAARKSVLKRAALYLLDSTVVHMAAKHGALIGRLDASGAVLDNPAATKTMRLREAHKAKNGTARDPAEAPS